MVESSHPVVKIMEEVAQLLGKQSGEFNPIAAELIKEDYNTVESLLKITKDDARKDFNMSLRCYNELIDIATLMQPEIKDVFTIWVKDQDGTDTE